MKLARTARAYICGPMAGRPEMNMPAFRDAASGIEARGDEPVVPHNLSPYTHPGADCHPVYGPGAGAGSTHDGGCYLRGDVAVMVHCDYIYRLPGWERSKGATIETAIAQALGIPIVDAS